MNNAHARMSFVPTSVGARLWNATKCRAARSRSLRAEIPLRTLPAARHSWQVHVIFLFTLLAVSAQGRSARADPPAAAREDLDLAAWLTAHHATLAHSSELHCEAVNVGDPPREGLLCERVTQVPGPRVEHRLLVYRFDAGRLRAVLEVFGGVSPLDFSPVEPGASLYPQYLVYLAAYVAPDGRSVVVSEHPEANCARAAANVMTCRPETETRRFCANTRSIVARACGAVGTYVFHDGMFRLEHPAHH
jgi:hypothetical protein